MTGGGGDASSSSTKRLAGGKRRQAETELLRQENARAVAAELRPPTDAELAAVAAATGPVVLLLHFVDGSTSARPSEQSAAVRLDPRRLPRVVGCSLLVPQPTSSRGDSSTVYHWALPTRGEGPAGGAPPPLAAAGWRLVAGLLEGSAGACEALITPNAKVVLRTLALLHPPTASAGGGHAASAATAAASGCRPIWRGLERWVDPILMGWLLEPDATEAALLLPSLYQHSAAAQGGQAGHGLASHDAVADGRDPHADGAAVGATPEAISDAAAAAAAGELPDTATECRALFELSKQLYARLRSCMQAQACSDVLRRELRVAGLLARMEVDGLPIAPSALRQHTESIESRLSVLHSQAETLLKAPLNLGSAQQVSEALHVQLQLPKPKQSDAAAKATHGSTSESHLKELAQRFPACPLPSWILEHRELTKLHGTFLEPYADRAVLPSEDDAGGGPSAAGAGASRPAASAWPPRTAARLHTNWLQFSTGTGRLSSRHPNVQQVPKGATTMRHVGATTTADVTISVRGAFVAPAGCLLVSADYSQLEMRLMAHISGDPRLQAELHAGGDLFRRVAGAWHRKPPESVSAVEREHTKQLCYGLTYGLGVERMANTMSLSVQEASQLRRGFLSSFPVLSSFTEHVRKMARTHLAVSTIVGRKRPLPHIVSSNSSERAKAERQAVNTAVQGSAADLMKEAMLRCCAALEARGLEARLIAQIHDELLFEVSEPSVATAVEVIRASMEAIDLAGRKLPPLPVSIVCGRSWGAMAPL